MRNFSVFALGLAHTSQLRSLCNSCKWICYLSLLSGANKGKLVEESSIKQHAIFALVLAFVQSIGITAAFHTLSQAKLVATPNTKTYLLIGAILTTGSMIVTWLESKSQIKGTVMVFQ